MDSPLLTIAVAVYNTGKYLKECMDSVINQTYQNLEIICVNDCSTDNSLEILAEYAAKDKRIQVITNEKNLGLGVVRNVGMDAAHGEYILFIDSDDWLDLTTCEKLISKAKENNSDIVFYSAYKVNGSQKREIKNFCNVSYPLNLEDRKTLIEKTLLSTWSKLLKLEFLKKKGIRFPNVCFEEEIKPHWLVCLLAKKIAFVAEYLYCYRKREGQLTQCTDKQLIQIVDVYSDLEGYLRGEKIYSPYKNGFLKQKFRFYFSIFLRLDIQFREEFFKKIRISLADKFFLLTHYRPLRHSIFLIFLKTPVIGVFEKLGRVYARCRLCKLSISE